MTPEQLNEIEKLAEAQEFLRAGSYALPLVKALREARSALEWQAAMTKALSESQERLVNEVKEARAEVERLREALRQTRIQRDADSASANRYASEAYELRKERNKVLAELEQTLAEVERLREAARQVHARLDRVTVDYDSGLNLLLCDIRKITKWMVE